MDFVIRDNDRQQVRQAPTQFVGEVLPVSFDFSPWADDNGAITSATWSIVSGSATISGEALSGNVASALITTASAGPTLVKILAVGATHTKRINFRVFAKDPQNWPVWDYGYRYG